MLALVLVISLSAQGAFALGWGDMTGVVTYNDLQNILLNCNIDLAGSHNFAIVEDKANHCWRIKDNSTGAWYTKANGKYPYVPIAGDVPDEPGNAPAADIAPPSISKNKFLDARVVKWSPRSIVTKDALANLVITLGKEGIVASLAQNTINLEGKSTKVWYVTNVNKAAVYCNSQGWPYTASADPSMADNNFDYIINNNVDNSDNSETVNNQVIDTSNNQMTVINENGDKITLNIDSLYWDDSTHSYVANTYNIENNVYNYYTYNITYNITNTYITYIGSNGAYQQDEYKYYYELPDGRSSEDLTAEEVGAMSFQFADVVNYARSATDTSLRALYHFDGNTEDSGYFSTQTKFKWEGGASITYMDSANFNGALYLDETTHFFDISLPSNLGSGDFSIQFRYYQASQPDTLKNVENSLAIGGTTILTWDERNFSWFGDNVTRPVPIGSWCEIALVRHNGVLRFYKNGLLSASKADTTGYQGKLSFSLGDTSRAYSMLDELRVVNFAIAEDGASYQCATAPYDTNLVLVLPDSAFPIADEYWEIAYPDGALLEADLTGGVQTDFSGAIQCFEGYSLFTAGKTSTSVTFSKSIPLGNYQFSLLLSDGSLCSISGTIGFDGNSNVTLSSSAYTSSTKTFDWGTLKFSVSYSSALTINVTPKSGKSLEVVAACFASPIFTADDFKAKKVSCIYSSEDVKANTAAVQSAIPVNGYAVGGVRPTFPVRGDVWFPVEGRRISGCYQYDGAMWRVAGCRWFTGERWIPIYAFDIYTLADCWDAADADQVDPTPPITSEQGFWNWFKKEWNDFRKWGNTSVEAIVTAIMAGGGAPSEECEEHTYRYKDIKAATCTAKGSQLFTCTKCGDTYTEDVDALGHDWIQIDDIQDTTDEGGNVIEKGYALWECSRCKTQHKDYERTGPPPDDPQSTITEMITDLFDRLGGLVGSVIDWLLDLGTEAVIGLGDIGDYFKEKSEEVSGFGGGFLLLLSGFFDIIPPELMTAMSLMIVFLVLGMFVKKVLLK